MWAWLTSFCLFWVDRMIRVHGSTFIFPAGAVSSICGAGWLTDFATFVDSFYMHLDTSILAFHRLEADCYFLFKSVSLPKMDSEKNCEDWTGIEDKKQRKKVQNRINQRAHSKYTTIYEAYFVPFSIHLLTEYIRKTSQRGKGPRSKIWTPSVPSGSLANRK
jgi:hypothetical protein